MRRFRDFQHHHRSSGVFSDNNGVILYTTIDLLKVNINIVAASNNDKNPVTKFEDPSGSQVEFYLGYHQDTTDLIGIAQEEDIRAGHYESLKLVEKGDTIEPVVEETDKDVDENSDSEEVDEVTELIKAEEQILHLLGNNEKVVEASLKRLEQFKVTPSILLENDIGVILYTKIYPLFSSETKVGKLCKKMFKKFENIARTTMLLL